MQILTVWHPAHQGNRTFITLWDAYQGELSKQKGFIGMSLRTDEINPNSYISSEEWESRDAYNAAKESLATSHPQLVDALLQSAPRPLRILELGQVIVSKSPSLPSVNSGAELDITAAKVAN